MTTEKQTTDTITGKPVLELKELSIDDPNTRRIYDITRDAITRLNIYVEDFFQTREILTEQLDALNNLDEKERYQEQAESLKEVTKRIDEVRADMESMAREMGTFIALKLVEPPE